VKYIIEGAKKNIFLNENRKTLWSPSGWLGEFPWIFVRIPDGMWAYVVVFPFLPSYNPLRDSFWTFYISPYFYLISQTNI